MWSSKGHYGWAGMRYTSGQTLFCRETKEILYPIRLHKTPSLANDNNQSVFWTLKLTSCKSKNPAFYNHFILNVPHCFHLRTIYLKAILTSLCWIQDKLSFHAYVFLKSWSINNTQFKKNNEVNKPGTKACIILSNIYELISHNLLNFSVKKCYKRKINSH